jgi:hypothetical protein
MAIPGSAPLGVASTLNQGPASFLIFVGKSSVQGVNCSLPVATRTGDLCIFFDAAADLDNTNSWSAVTPSGFSKIISTNDNYGTSSSGSYMRSLTSYKVLEDSDIAAGVISGMNRQEERKVLFIFRPNRPISNVATMVTSYMDYNNPSARTVTSGSSGGPLVVFVFAHRGYYHNDNVVNLNGSSSFDGTETDASLEAMGGYKIYNTSPVNFTANTGKPGIAFPITLHAGYLRVS